MRLPGVLGVGLTLPAALANLGSLILIGGISGAYANVLRELGCEGVEEAFERLDALWTDSTQKWLRHTAPQANDHKSRSRWSDSAW